MMDSEQSEGEGRYEHVKRLVEDRLGGAPPSFNQDGEVRYGDRSMGNLYEFLDKIIDVGCLPPARERLEDLLKEELNLDQRQVQNFLGGLTEGQKSLLIRTIAECDVSLAERTYSEKLRKPDERTAREGLLRMLPGTFLKNGARSFGGNVLPNRIVSLDLSLNAVPDSKDYEAVFSFSIEPSDEDTSWLQDLSFRVIDEDGKVLARNQKFASTGKLSLRLANLADYPEHARFVLNTEE